jgi:hypothetical protein
MSRHRKRITVDAEVAAALRRRALGEFGGYHVEANGDITFEVDDEVAAELERYRQPGDDESTLLRRVLKQRAGIDVPPKKAN